MYNISDEQIEFILSDIKNRGVEMVDLQLNLLDHVCCIIEQNLEANGDFRAFYTKTISGFFKKELKEIEAEAKSLVMNKHYYTMKKVMLNSGIIAAVLLSTGIFFKFMHWPGAAPCIVLGIATFSFVFLPLMFTLKLKEEQQTKNKVLMGLGVGSAMLLTLSVLFKIQHWPGTMIMGYLTMAIMLLVFLPIYYTAGIKNPETKTNTIVTSVLLVAGCGLWFTLVVTPTGVRMNNIQSTLGYLRNEQMLKNEQKQTNAFVKNDGPTVSMTNEIDGMCEELKSFVIKDQTGIAAIGPDFEQTNTFISDKWFNFSNYPEEQAKLDMLKRKVTEYNDATAKLSNPALQIIPVKATVLETNEEMVPEILNDLIQIQMFVFQNKREMAQSASTAVSKI